jgi:acylglycerol lipase
MICHLGVQLGAKTTQVSLPSDPAATDVSAPRGEAAAPLQPDPGADWVVGDDGQRLYSRWQRPVDPHGVVWYVLGPECGAAFPYPRLTQALLDAGFVVTLMHARGTGYSPGARGDIRDYQAFLEDYRRFRAEIERRFPGLPVFLLGQSVGATLAAHVAATGALPLAGVALVNAAYRLRNASGMTPTWRQYVAYAVNLILRPSAPVVDMNSRPSDVTFGPDREEALAMQRDPVVVRYFSMRTLLAQKRLMNRLPANVAALTVPVLIIEGAHDALVDPSGNDELLARAAVTGSARVVAPDGGHGSSAVETAVEPLVCWLEARLVTPSPVDIAACRPGGPERRSR